jgi:hypothetical protein
MSALMAVRFLDQEMSPVTGSFYFRAAGTA